MSRNVGNDIISKKVEDVRHCLAELARRNLTITDINIGEARKPTITIIGYNNSPGGLKGGTKTRIRAGLRNLETYATEVSGCQVQWKVVA
ncbi:hypothetical protein [uncultured Methylophaga sp.]|uniref:hypothetical protein n=1 Tax=uncultured Methylophaga sp. TaxID=285271 RepID=UPI00260D4994|nr:hypothetical protein [uncultured Methylophaga sp.]